MLLDIKHAVRSLLRTPGFTLVALVILALCIGANTAIFTMVKKVLLDPLPYPESEQLVNFQNLYPAVGVHRGSNATPDYFDRKELTDVFEGVSIWTINGFEFGASDAPQRLDADIVTPDFFQVLRAAPFLGRTFTEADATQEQGKVAILSHGLWRKAFASDPNVLGKDIRLNGESYRIVGVMPAGFSVRTNYVSSQVWVPLVIDPAWKDEYHNNRWGMIGRLKKDVSLAQAQKRIDALNRANIDRIPQLAPLVKQSGFRTSVSRWKDMWVSDARSTLYLLQGAAALVLLIGAVNVASLMLVRSNIRMRDLVVRFSLGASRGVLARQLITESLVLSLAAGVVGLGIAFVGLKLLNYLGASELPRGAGITIDATILSFNCLASFLIGFIFGLIPVRGLWRQDLAQVFRSTERTGTAERGAVRVRSMLVATQIGLAFVLLTGSALLVLSFDRLLRVNPGFSAEGIATAEISLPMTRYGQDAGKASAFVENVIHGLESTSGVTQAAVTTYLPMGGARQSSVVLINGQPPPAGENPPVPKWNTVSDGYFRTLGIPLLEGRAITAADDLASQKVVVIDQSLARRYWPKSSPLGHKISLGAGSSSSVVTIVGVAGSVKADQLSDREQVGQIYLSHKQFPIYSMHFVLKGQMSEAALFAALRRAVAQQDPQLPLVDMKTLSQRVDDSIAQSRAAMFLCVIFGGLAAFLAAIGIYGVLAYSVSQRTREFGIRLALGAQVGNLIRSVMVQGLWITLIGVASGVIGAAMVTRFIGSLLYEVAPTNPLVFAGIGVLMAVVTMFACYLPARQTTRIEPMIALRTE